ncbi:MAG: hypothetical protein QOE98_1414 [Gaiellaceae bacterium]|nr:hypothetical protein [Gaiellaceae bacterium]
MVSFAQRRDRPRSRSCAPLVRVASSRWSLRRRTTRFGRKIRWPQGQPRTPSLLAIGSARASVRHCRHTPPTLPVATGAVCARRRSAAGRSPHHAARASRPMWTLKTALGAACRTTADAETTAAGGERRTEREDASGFSQAGAGFEWWPVGRGGALPVRQSGAGERYGPRWNAAPRPCPCFASVGRRFQRHARADLNSPQPPPARNPAHQENQLFSGSDADRRAWLGGRLGRWLRLEQRESWVRRRLELRESRMR